MPNTALKLMIRVDAGLYPGAIIPKYTRVWNWSAEDQAAYAAGEPEAIEKYVRIAGESREYAATLENPRIVNWVRRDWVWM